MLFRFREAQLQEMGLLVPRTMRAPSNVQLATSVRECERWRREVFDEVSKKITRIQDGKLYGQKLMVLIIHATASLAEHQIRDLNDEINRLLRKKQSWENRIRELGGPDYRRGAARMFDADGKEVPGNRGYK
jgi:pre-mRNA-splicing factor ISY1